MLNLRFRYFTELYSGRRFAFRGFASLSYQHVINQFTGEFVSLENNNGIKGLTDPAMRGDEKLLLNLESVIFSPYRLLGFRLVFFASADLGLIWNHNTAISGSNFYNGLGFGVRIRNDKLVFDTFEIKFTFYPGLPEDAIARYFEVGNVSSLRLSNFYPDGPSTLKYQP